MIHHYLEIFYIFIESQILYVKECIREMRIGKSRGPDDITVEVWKCAGERGIAWLSNYLIISYKKEMLDEWRRSTLVAIYKIKIGIQICTSYYGIKMTSRIRKWWEITIRQKLRHETNVSDKQYGLMSERSIMEVG